MSDKKFQRRIGTVGHKIGVPKTNLELFKIYKCKINEVKITQPIKNKEGTTDIDSSLLFINYYRILETPFLWSKIPKYQTSTSLLFLPYATMM